MCFPGSDAFPEPPSGTLRKPTTVLFFLLFSRLDPVIVGIYNLLNSICRNYEENAYKVIQRHMYHILDAILLRI